jgi:integrase/recombinase XerD
MTSLRQQMTDEMQLRGLSSRTQQSYLNAVRQLAEYYHKPPDQIGEEELRTYFLYLMNEKQLSPSSCRVAHYALRFLYVKTLGIAWPAGSGRAAAERDQAAGGAQCGRGATDPGLCAQTRLSGLSEHDLRLRSAAERGHLATSRGHRRRAHVAPRAPGQGSQDRYVPLPEATLEMLRTFWTLHRHPTWLFPGRPSEGEPYALRDPDVAEWRATGHACCCESVRHPEACNSAYVAPLLCDTPVGSGRQSASDSSLSGPQFPQDHGPLHPS